jgi:ribosome-binding protein aMBF1 (putative translation factor)
MSITGAQIREARLLLNWERKDLAKRAKLQTHYIERAEASEGEPAITIAHRNAIQSALRSRWRRVHRRGQQRSGCTFEEG